MSFILHDNYHIIETFVTERGAKISFTRKWRGKYPNAVVVRDVEFHATEPMVESTNIMSGKKIMIPASQKGGCCDPGTETYWCS